MDQVKYRNHGKLITSDKLSCFFVHHSKFSGSYILLYWPFVLVIGLNKLLPFLFQFLMLVLVLDLNDLYSLQLE
jgi:hypothetical protein